MNYSKLFLSFSLSLFIFSCKNNIVELQKENFIGGSSFSKLFYKPTFYIYSDEGASSQCVAQTRNTLSKFLSTNYFIQEINAEKIKEGSWKDKAALLVMPGGADRPYAKKLNGEGNRQIRQFVENGGAYLGICAGAYYGSSFVEFDKNGPLQVIEQRELKFFPGKSIGPILANYDYKSNSGLERPLYF